VVVQGLVDNVPGNPGLIDPLVSKTLLARPGLATELVDLQLLASYRYLLVIDRNQRV
jgi:hypothetical protein